MNYAEIKEYDIANGPGVRISLFVSGCTHKCPGCFNEVAWDFSYGKLFTKDVEDRIISLLQPYYISGLSILGGEPMEPENQEVLLPFIKRVREESPKSTIWIYSGYIWEELYFNKILELIDVLVDGEFHIKEKDITLKFRGSRNQRIIDVQKSLKKGFICSYERN